MLDASRWRAQAGNGRCLSLPGTTSEINGQFTTMIVRAPEFRSLQRATTYPVTLEMVYGVQFAAIEGLAARCKRPEARVAYEGALEQLNRAYEHFRAGDDELGRLRTVLARHLFREGALPCNRINEINAAQGVLQRILARERDLAAESLAEPNGKPD